MITVDEVHDFANSWFNTVANGGSAADQAAFFLDPHSRIYVLSNGTTFNFEEHQKLHARWINELHRFGHFNLMPLNVSPERVRATGTVTSSRSSAVQRRRGHSRRGRSSRR